MVGYLIAIYSINPILPQALLLQNLVQQVIATCLACAVSLLQLYCAVKAREHTSPLVEPVGPPPPPETPTPPLPYNSSAAAVTAIWLVFQVYLVSYVRSVRPDLMFSCIPYTTFAVVTSSIAPTFPNMTVSANFAIQLVEVSLSGYAISAVVMLFILPDTSRKRNIVASLDAIEKCLSSRATLLEKLITTLPAQGEKLTVSHDRPPLELGIDSMHSIDSNAAIANLVRNVTGLDTDLVSARREFTVGKLDADDLTSLHQHVHEILQPTLGLTAYEDYSSNGAFRPRTLRNIARLYKLKCNFP